MTYTLTPEQLADLQDDVAIGVDELTFTNDKLNRNFNRAEGDYATAVVITLRQLRAAATKFFNYSVGQTKYDRGQIFRNLSDLLADAEKKAGMSGGSLSAGVIYLGLDTEEDDDTTVWSW